MLRALLRFNLLFLPCLLAAALGTGFLTHDALHRRAEAEVLQNARMMMETAGAARTYTTKQIASLIEQERERLETATVTLRQTLDERLPAALQAAADRVNSAKDKANVTSTHRAALDFLRQEAARNVPAPEFYPQSVPAYAATEVFNYFRGRYPDYSYKEACLNPTNPRDRTVDWEADVVNSFRGGSAERKEIINRRTTPTGESLFLAAPIRITNRSCLVCHSTPEAAPAEMLRLYGRNNGFGWKMDEVIGAQIVSVPVAVATTSAEAAFRALLLPLGGVFAGIFLLGNVAALLATRRSVAVVSVPAATSAPMTTAGRV